MQDEAVEKRRDQIREKNSALMFIRQTAASAIESLPKNLRHSFAQINANCEGLSVRIYGANNKVL